MIDATTIMTGGRARMHGRRKYLGRPETLGELPESVKLDFAIGHARIASSLGFLSKNYRKPIGVTDLMKVAGLSRRGFLKAFRKHTGRTPGEVLRQVRLKHAKRLLVECNLPMTDLATASGYRRANSFWVAFRRATGESPKEYLRRSPE